MRYSCRISKLCAKSYLLRIAPIPNIPFSMPCNGWPPFHRPHLVPNHHWFVAGLALDLEMESNGDQPLAPQSDACASCVGTDSLVGLYIGTMYETGQPVEQLDVSTSVNGWTPMNGWNVA